MNLSRSAAASMAHESSWGRIGLRGMSTSSGYKPNTGIVMLNMGGPGSLDGERDGVKAFLTRLFTDNEIIPLGPFQSTLVS